MSKKEEYQKELTRWNELFTQADEQTKKAVDGLIQKAAFLHSMCWELEEVIKESGAIKVHPTNPSLQKQVLATKEYARLAESYANITNRLNTLRKGITPDEDNDLEEFE